MMQESAMNPSYLDEDIVNVSKGICLKCGHDNNTVLGKKCSHYQIRDYGDE